MTDNNNQAQRPDLWMTETTTPGLMVQTDLNHSIPDEPMFGGSGKPQRATVQGKYQLRRYDPQPQYKGGYPHEGSDDLPYLLSVCKDANQCSVQADGFEQWWITDDAGEIIYPLETKPRVYTSPAAEFDDVLRPMKDIQAITNAPALHDFLFLTRDVDDAERRKRLEHFARELELTATHVRQLLAGEAWND